MHCRFGPPLRVLLLLLLLDAGTALRVAVYGGSGYIGSHVCRALVACGCSVVSVSRSGPRTAAPSDAFARPRRHLDRFDADEPWLSQVEWYEADAAVDGAAAALASGIDAAVSCIGDGSLLEPALDSWQGNRWSPLSTAQYAANFEPNAMAVAAAKAAGAATFVFLGAAAEAELGYGGSLPGLYTGKRDAATAGQVAFGDGFVQVGPTQVVDAGDPRLKLLDSGVSRSLLRINQLIGTVASMGEDFATTAKLRPAVSVDDVAEAVAAIVTGQCTVAESERYVGYSVPSGRQGSEVRFALRQVDGAEEIRSLARSARGATSESDAGNS
jgi:NAD(P)-dependent dehydrogenase (short-subunit alcohol dehydrogenase family)